MSEMITFALPEPLAYSARPVAARTSHRVEEVLVEWLDQAAAGLPVEILPDEQVLALCDLQTSDEQQKDRHASHFEGCAGQEGRL